MHVFTCRETRTDLHAWIGTIHRTLMLVRKRDLLLTSGASFMLHVFWLSHCKMWSWSFNAKGKTHIKKCLKHFFLFYNGLVVIYICTDIALLLLSLSNSEIFSHQGMAITIFILHHNLWNRYNNLIYYSLLSTHQKHDRNMKISLSCARQTEIWSCSL